MPHDSVTGFGSGGLGRFRGDDRSTDFALDNLPFDLLEQFDRLAKFGQFGEGGVDRIVGEAVGGAQRSAGLNRRLRRKGLAQRSGVGRRLGPRSGALDTFIANQFQAPTDAALAAQQVGLRTGLRREQAGSQLRGLQGIQGIMEFLAQRQAQSRAQEGQGTGFLDILGPLATIGATAFGGPGAGAAVGTATGAANRGRPRGEI